MWHSYGDISLSWCQFPWIGLGGWKEISQWRLKPIIYTTCIYYSILCEFSRTLTEFHDTIQAHLGPMSDAFVRIDRLQIDVFEESDKIIFLLEECAYIQFKEIWKLEKHIGYQHLSGIKRLILGIVVLITGYVPYIDWITIWSRQTDF